MVLKRLVFKDGGGVEIVEKNFKDSYPAETPPAEIMVVSNETGHNGVVMLKGVEGEGEDAHGDAEDTYQATYFSLNNIDFQLEVTFPLEDGDERLVFMMWQPPYDAETDELCWDAEAMLDSNIITEPVCT